MKKILSLLLALELILNVASALAFSSDYRDYVDWPITDQPITVTIGIKLENSATDWTLEDNWFFNWAMAKTGLTFEFETIQASALADQKQLLFNSDQLPDVMWGWGLTPVEMVKYGSQENMLLPLNQYMTPEIMPNLCKWLEAYPETYDAITALDGNIYSLPYYYKLTRSAGGSTRVFINETHLKELGKEKPKTLDEMVDVLYAFKQAHPDLTPVGASASGSDLRDFFLNAYGYICEGSNDYGMGVALRNGKLLIPAADPTFKDFLTLMNQFYNDGIIFQDYFLLDKDTVSAEQRASRVLLIEDAPPGDDYDSWKNWTASYPLTSEQNSERVWLGSKLFQCGGMALSSNCEHPAEFLKFIDFFYSDLGIVYTWNGPVTGSEDAMGNENVGYTIAEDGNFVTTGVKNGIYASAWSNNLHFQLPCGICVGANCCSVTHPELNTEVALLSSAAGIEPKTTAWNVTSNKDNYFRASMEEFVTPYETSDYPFYVYMTEEQTNRVNELRAVIAPYVEREVAEFITGARSLDEFDQFVSELESMGIREYEQLYRDATGR